MFGAEELPSAVTLVCDVCGREVTTRLSGNTTRCPKRSGGCGAPITVPAGSTRPPVAVGCYACGHQWKTRAREGGTVRCPKCRHPRRVPTGARDRLIPSSPRVYREAPEPDPEERPATPRREGRSFLDILGGIFRPPAEPGRVLDCLHCEHQWHTTAAPGNAVRCPECGRMRRIPTGTPRPRTATRQAPAPATPRAALPAPSRPAAAPPQGPQPIDPSTLDPREVTRRDRVCTLVRSLGTVSGLLTWYNQPPGYCEALDTHQLPDAQRCPRGATHIVQYQEGASLAHAYACASHAGPLAALADTSPYVTATVQPRRSR